MLNFVILMQHKNYLSLKWQEMTFPYIIREHAHYMEINGYSLSLLSLIKTVKKEENKTLEKDAVLWKNGTGVSG